jgi:hypothetical protein
LHLGLQLHTRQQVAELKDFKRATLGLLRKLQTQGEFVVQR